MTKRKWKANEETSGRYTGSYSWKTTVLTLDQI